MKKISILFWLFFIVLFNSCKKSDTPAPPSNNNTTPGITVTTTGYLSSTLKFQSIGGFFATYTSGAPNQLFIGGSNATENFNLSLKWSSGGFPPSNLNFNLDVGSYNSNQFGFGSYNPNTASANNYSSYGIGGGGTCSITNIDQTAKTVSGTFNFTAGYWNNNGTNPVAGQTTTFSGSFTKVPY
jgi:Family of unknown function (DUF6252)